MSAAGFALLAVAVLIGYEALKHFGVLGSTSAASAAGPATSPNLGVNASNGSGVIPASWLQALAAHESPSALQGNYQYGVFGLSAGSTPGIGYPGSTAYSSQDPHGGTFTPQIFSSWEEAVSGLSLWINRHAPSAWQAQTCQQFVAALEAGGYGDLGNMCSGVS